LEGRYSPRADKHWGGDVYGEDKEYYQLYFADRAYTGVSTDETYHWKLRPDNNWDYYTKWEGFDSYASKRTHSAEFYHDLEKYTLRPFPIMQNGDVMLDLNAGGPVPGLSNTKFFMSGYWNRSEYPLMASRDHSQEYNATFKLTRRMSQNTVLVFTAIETFMNTIVAGETSGRGGESNIINETFSRGGTDTYLKGDDKVQFGRTWNSRWNWIWNNSAANVLNTKRHAMNLKFTHTLSPASYYEVSTGATIYESDRDHMRGVDPTIIKYIYDSKTGNTYGFDEYPRGYGERDWVNAEGWAYSRQSLTGMELGHEAKGTHDNLNNDFYVKADFVSQVNRYNQVKAGIQFAYSHANTRFDYDQSYRGHPITERPFQWSKWKADPVQLEWYFQDKLEWEGLILNAGIRGLTFFPRVDGFDLGEHNYWAYDDEGTPIWSGELQWGTDENGEKWMFENMRTRKLKQRLYLQPRFGISHPITESSKIFFNYGHFFTSPHWNMLYSVQTTSTIGSGGRRTGLIPQPDIRWPKVVSYEIGYSQSIYNQVLLQISGYYKDYANEIVTNNFQNYAGDINAYMWDNHQYRDIRGLEFRLERSFGRFLNGWANYNYMIGSRGITGFAIIYQDPTRMESQWYNSGQEKPEVTPSFRLNVSLRTPVNWGPGSPILGIKPFAEWRLNFLYTYRARPRWLTNSNEPPKDWRYVERTGINMIDTYLTKRLMRGAQFYLNIKNIFNIQRFKNDGSGSYRDSLHLWFESGDQKGNDKVGETPDYAYKGHPEWGWYLPQRRDIYFGIRYQF